MKLEIDETTLIDTIVRKVVEQIIPIIKCNFESKDNELMTVDEVAKYLKAKKSTIYDKVHSKSIPFLKHGNTLRFRRKHIELWLQNPYHPELNIYNLNNDGRR